MCSDGAELLEATAPPEAAIYKVLRSSDVSNEREYWLDRRRLGEVRVLARFAHNPVAGAAAK